jgi:hypothetical protein
MASIEMAVIHAEVIRYRKGRAHRSARARPEQQGQRSDAGAGAVPPAHPRRPLSKNRRAKTTHTPTRTRSVIWIQHDHPGFNG